MSTLGPNDRKKKDIEMEVIQVMRQEDYTLNTMNSSGENLLHISAANGCTKIVKEILAKGKFKNVIDRKNTFGWTALMVAIRNRDVETVKWLLKSNSSTDESTYLGMSVLGLAAAINVDMLETIYNAFPSALHNASNDDITPLCIAALKNDKDLFFRLADLGFQPSKANQYTQIMMRKSSVPEISSLAEKHLETDDYWNDPCDIINTVLDPKEFENTNVSHRAGTVPIQTGDIQVECSEDFENELTGGQEKLSENANEHLLARPIFTFDGDKQSLSNGTLLRAGQLLKPLNLNVLLEEEPSLVQKSLISPGFSLNVEEAFPKSPNICFVEDDSENKNDESGEKGSEDKSLAAIEQTNAIESVEFSVGETEKTPILLQRLQSIRPPDLNISSPDVDLNTTLGYIPQFSPLRSPLVPAEINDENVFGVHTPTPPRHRTPPRGMILNSEEMKMFILLKRYNLNRLAPIFLKQEVDVDLFLTLTDADLIEIGIEKQSDRTALLAAITDCQRITSFYET